MGYPAMDYYSAAKRYKDALYILIGSDVQVKLFREKSSVHKSVQRKLPVV